jgi:Flp pilus assembly protein TadG
MRWMMRRAGRDRDRGAVALVVALCLSFGLLGLGAVAIDVGSWYGEKAQVQNGADAAALAVAHSCALLACDTSLATTYANDNANDGSTNTPIVCGQATGSSPGLPACGSECPAGTGNYVNVGAVSDSPLPALLSRFIPGSSGSGETIRACAQARWGPAVINGDVLAFTIAECVWNGATAPLTPGGPRNYAPSPPTVPAASYEHALVVHTPTDATDPLCVSGPSVGPLPGGFGWTDTSGSCTTTFNAVGGGWYLDSSGVSTSTGTGCGTGGGGPNGVIPCARNPVVTSPPFPSGGTSSCPTPPTPSPLIVPVYDAVCVQPGTSAANEVQTVTVTNATSGTYTLTFANTTTSATTSAIAYNATAAVVQAALESLSTIGAGNVSVAGAVGGPYTVTFIGALGNLDVAQMTADGTALRPNTGPGSGRASVSVATTTNGSNSTTGCPAGFANGKYFHLETLAGFVVTGYNGVAGISPSKDSWLTGRNYCVSTTGTDPPCIMGYFVQATITGGGIGTGGEDTGVTVVELSG